MKNEKLKYIVGELKTIGLFGLVGSVLTTTVTAGWWWDQPYGTGAMMMFGSFAVFALLGLLSSLHDDYRVMVFVERRHDRWHD